MNQQPPGPPYPPQPPFQPSPVSSAKPQGLAVASLVFGIIGFLTGFIGIGVLLGIVALILGIISLAKRHGGTGLAIAGLITGGIAVLFGVVMFAIAIIAYLGIQDRAADATNRSMASSVAAHSNAYATLNDAYPSYSELINTTDPLVELDEAILENLHNGDDETVTPERPLAYTSCQFGSLIFYWQASDQTVGVEIAGDPYQCDDDQFNTQQITDPDQSELRLPQAT